MPIAAVRDIDGEKVTNVVGRCPLDPTLRVSSSRSCHFQRNAARPPLCRDAPLCTNAGHRLREGHRASSTLLVASQLRRTDLSRHPATWRPAFWDQFVGRQTVLTGASGGDKSLPSCIHAARVNVFLSMTSVTSGNVSPRAATQSTAHKIAVAQVSSQKQRAMPPCAPPLPTVSRGAEVTEEEFVVKNICWDRLSVTSNTSQREYC
jgi:hypothetical protein